MSTSILVTGAAGFIASHMTNYLVKKYPEKNIVGLDKLDYCSRLSYIKFASEQKNFCFIRNDLTDLAKVTTILEEHRVGTILHFAANTHVDRSFQNPLEFVQNNIVGTSILLEAARKSNIKLKVFLYVGTDEQNGDSSDSKVTEDFAMCPSNPYAATKCGAELIAQSYRKSFKMPILITRCNNVYGPHQYPEKVIAKFINHILANKNLTIHGQGNHKRCYIYVDDVIKAMDHIITNAPINTEDRVFTANVYNIGSDFEMSNLELAEYLLGRYGTTSKSKIVFVEDRLYNDLHYRIDWKKLKTLGFTPQVEWETGIQKTYDYFAKIFAESEA